MKPIDGCYSEGSQMPDVTKILFWSLQKWDWNVVSLLQQHLNESKEVGYVLVPNSSNRRGQAHKILSNIYLPTFFITISDSVAIVVFCLHIP